MSKSSNVEAVIGPMSKIGPMSGLMSRYSNGPMSRQSNVKNWSNVEILLWSNFEGVQCRGSNGPIEVLDSPM